MSTICKIRIIILRICIILHLCEVTYERMSNCGEQEIIDKIILNYETDTGLIDKIKRGLAEKYDLNEFTIVPLDIKTDCSVNSDQIFEELYRTQIQAQTMLNSYYYMENYDGCLLHSKIVEDLRTHYKELNHPETASDVNKLISIILRYLILSQILSKREIIPVAELCEFCDNELVEDDLQCPICLADVIPLRNQRVYHQNNTNINKSNKRSENPPCNWWECSVCTYHNKLTDTECDTCLNKKPEKIDLNYRNKIDFFESLNDEIIGEDSIQSNQSELHSRNIDYYNQSNDTWPCPSCTFKNRLENPCCEVCCYSRDLNANDTEVEDIYPDFPLQVTENRAESTTEIESRTFKDWIIITCVKYGNKWVNYDNGAESDYDKLCISVSERFISTNNNVKSSSYSHCCML